MIIYASCRFVRLPISKSIFIVDRTLRRNPFNPI